MQEVTETSPRLYRAAREHFRLYQQLLVAQLCHSIEHNFHPSTRDVVHETFTFLRSYQPDAIDRLRADIAVYEAQTTAHLPIRTLRQTLNLSDIALLYLLATGMVEENLKFGVLYATLQSPLNQRYPCIGLLDRLLSDGQQPDGERWAISEMLTRQRLVTIKRDENTPHLEWTLRVPLAVWMALRGDVVEQPVRDVQRQAAHTFPPLDALIVPDAIRAQLDALPAMLRQNQLDALVVRGMVGVGRRTMIGSLARHFGRDILLLDTPQNKETSSIAGIIATLTDAIPILRLEANPGETITLEPLTGYRGMVGITMGRTGGVSGTLLHRSLTLMLPAPDYQARAQFWQVANCVLEDECAIVDQFLLTGGRIQRVAHLAMVQAQIAGRSQVTVTDVQQAMRSINRHALETLATPLTPIDDWQQLIVNEQTAEALRMLRTRCEMRERLLNHVGMAFEQNLNRGVRALFSGASGTGKTLAVRALAGALHMDVYRVDLAGVVNKYIGETEKNLNRVFTYAEELDVLLLLDEGDSLMTRRTDVSGANDRYANLETNFLLQRLESYEGILVVTTNAAQRIDDAFMRRLDVVIDFTLPDLPQRRRLWQIHLPAQHTIEPQFLEYVVQRCDLTGGQIRNTALSAALLALSEQQPVTGHHLDDALRREYQKASLPYPIRYQVKE